MSRQASPRRRLFTLIGAWSVLLIVETLGQVAIRLAGTDVGAFELDRHSIGLALREPWLWVGLGCYIAQFGVWMTILEKSALSAAFPTSAIVLVTVLLASWGLLGEAMGWEKLLGSAIIVAGILLLGGDTEPAPPARPRSDAEGNPT